MSDLYERLVREIPWHVWFRVRLSGYRILYLEPIWEWLVGLITAGGEDW